MLRKSSQKKSYKIGVLSDTHKREKRSQQVINHLLGEGAQFFIHAGDIVKEEMLQQLVATRKKYVAVYGNNDAHLISIHNKYNLQQEPHYFKLADTKFKLMHLPFYLNPDSEVIIFGHTHTFECDFKNGTLYLNPGETCARNKPISECALLEVTPTHFNVNYYSRGVDDKTFKTKHFSFERDNK